MTQRQRPKPRRGNEYFKEPEGPISMWPEVRLVEKPLALPRAWFLLLSILLSQHKSV